MMYDVVIIGAGIVGSSIAYRLSKYDMNLLVVDKENDVANEVSMANSAIVHAGDDPKEGTLKAKMNLRGAKLYPELCEKLNVPFRKTGAFTIMTTPEQEIAFQELVQKCQNRNIPYEILSKEEVLAQEPHATPNVIKALSLPTAGVIMPWIFAIHSLQVALKNGATVQTNTEVQSIESKEDYIELQTNQGTIQTKYLINAAGLYSATIANMVYPTEHKVLPHRGEYFVLSQEVGDYVSHILYPIPTKKGKGVLAVPTADGNILIGPNNQEVETPLNNNTTLQGLNEVREKITSVLDQIPNGDIIRIFAGIRPTSETGDFIMEKDPTNQHIFHLIGIDSPGVASAPGIAEYLEEVFPLPYPIKDSYEDSLPKKFSFKDLSPEEKDAYIKEHPEYGHIVCRCEQISEGEIIEAIHEPLGAKTVKGVKKRVRPGMGKCQGGFCGPLVVGILARELGIPKEEVLYDALGSNLLHRKEGS